MLNDNWDRIDQNVETITGAQAKANQAEQNAKNYADQKVSAISFPVQSVNNKTGAVTLTASDVGASPTGHTHTFAEITNKPTTLSGYGITDAIPTSQKGAANGVASLDGSAKVPTTQLPSASTTQAGIVQLDDTLTNTSTTKAATANAVKQVNDAVVAHSADYVKHPAVATTTNTGNDYSVTLDPAPTSYVANMGIVVTINADSTGAATLNVNGLGAKPILKANGNAVSNLKTNGVYTVRYNPSANGGNGAFILQGEGGGGTAQPKDVLSGKTFTNDSGEQTGTMPNKVGSGTIITPSTSDIAIPQGYYGGALTDGKVKGDPNLIASNIKQGVSIFGVVGSLIQGKKWARGTVTSSSSQEIFYDSYGNSQSRYYVSVGGLPFSTHPSTILVWNSYIFSFTIYHSGFNLDDVSNADILLILLPSSTARLQQNVGAAVLNPFNFQLPVSTVNTTYSWLAIE
ncbi:MAG: tail fiber protein [Anoxybacillus ayderensis]|nr:tail fiber protein [Anoxybacillus ayderensis]